MVKSFQIKQYIVAAASFSLYFMYLWVRLEGGARTNLKRLYKVKNPEIYPGEIYRKIDGCRSVKNMKVRMSFEQELDIISTAYLLKQQKMQNWLQEYAICFDYGRRTVLMDLRRMIQLFFAKILNIKSIFTKYQLKNPMVEGGFGNEDGEDENYYYALNSLSLPDAEVLETFGYMIGLAVVTESFLDMKLADHFYKSIFKEPVSINILDTDLEHVDPEQFNIYRNYDPNDIVFCFDTSNRPFRVKKNPGQCTFDLHYSNSMPEFDTLLYRAAQVIFIERANDHNRIIKSGIRKSIYLNDYDPILVLLQKSCTRRLDINLMKRLDVAEWIHYSDLDLYELTRTFWLALKSLHSTDQWKVYTKITGHKHFPSEGFRVLPTINFDYIDIQMLGNHEYKMFPDIYVVNLKRYSSVKQTVGDIIEQVNG